MDTNETSFNDMQRVKREFFAMRNGVIADTLRRAGSPFRIIFGLNLPQIAEIAYRMPKGTDLAERLWGNSTTRESMLIAPMLVDRDSFTIDKARDWVSRITAHEVADVMCLKLLRHMPYAADMAEELAGGDDAMARYTAIRLMFNIVSADPRRALALAEHSIAHDSDRHCLALARQLKDECLFLLDEA